MPKLKYNLDEIEEFHNVAPGRYKAKLVKVEKKPSKAGDPQLVWTWKILSGKEKGNTIRSWTSLLPDRLGNMKNHLTAFGLKGKVNSSTDSLIGKEVVLVVSQTDAKTGSGKFSNVDKVLKKGSSLKAEEPVEDDDEYEDEEDDEEDDEDFDDEDDDEEDEDDDEDEEDEDEEPRKKSKSKSKLKSRKKSDDDDDDDEDDDDEDDEDEDDDDDDDDYDDDEEDDDDEEEEAPKKSKKSKKSSKKGRR